MLTKIQMAPATRFKIASERKNFGLSLLSKLVGLFHSAGKMQQCLASLKVFKNDVIAFFFLIDRS